MNLSITNTPYIFLWVIIPVLIILGVSKQNTAIDIQMHDTYFVVAIWHLGLILSLFVGLIGGLYWLFNDWEWVGWMTAFHTAITVFFALFCMLQITNANGYLNWGVNKRT